MYRTELAGLIVSPIKFNIVQRQIYLCAAQYTTQISSSVREHVLSFLPTALFRFLERSRLSRVPFPIVSWRLRSVGAQRKARRIPEIITCVWAFCYLVAPVLSQQQESAFGFRQATRLLSSCPFQCACVSGHFFLFRGP